MRALSVKPEQRSSAQLDEWPEPPVDEASLLLETLAIGVCGTDREIVAGDYGAPPPGAQRLILGHESISRVVRAPAGSGFSPGDLAVAIVRHPDPVPCANCAAGEWDMCRNGLYTEHGIKGLHGFCAERFTIEPRFAVPIDRRLERVGVLLEPASILAKAWEQIERIGRRSVWQPKRVLVTGAGPIGLLAALMGVQRGLDTHVLDRVTGGRKPELVRALGAHYHCGTLAEASHEADIIIECTGVGRLVLEAMQHTAPGGIACLTGISSGGRLLEVDAGELNRGMVLENDVVFGSVNANRRHYELARASLQQADAAWLGALITRRVPLDRWADALEKDADDVKAVIDFAL